MNISKQYFTGQKTQNPQCSYHNQIQIGIGHGFGKRQPWSFNLQKIMQSEGVKVWNEPIDESGKFPDAEKWSETLQLNIEKNSSWILHSASGIAFLDAMLKVNIQIQDIYFVAVWLQDPKFPNGSLGARMFNRQGKYYLQPFFRYGG